MDLILHAVGHQHGHARRVIEDHHGLDGEAVLGAIDHVVEPVVRGVEPALHQRLLHQVVLASELLQVDGHELDALALEVAQALRQGHGDGLFIHAHANLGQRRGEGAEGQAAKAGRNDELRLHDQSSSLSNLRSGGTPWKSSFSICAAITLEGNGA